MVVVVMAVSLFLPLWQYIDESGIRYELYPLHYSIVNGDAKSTDYFPYCATAILMVAAATLAIQTIRRYDNRLLQVKLAAFNTIFLMLVMGAVVYFSSRLNEEFKYVGMSRGALWTVFAGVAFNWLAMRFIRRDEKLVKDSERLR